MTSFPFILSSVSRTFDSFLLKTAVREGAMKVTKAVDKTMNWMTRHVEGDVNSSYRAERQSINETK